MSNRTTIADALTEAPQPPITIQGTVEQHRKNRAALEWLRRRQSELVSMSNEDRERGKEEWRVFAESMNQCHDTERIPYPPVTEQLANFGDLSHEER